MNTKLTIIITVDPQMTPATSRVEETLSLLGPLDLKALIIEITLQQAGEFYNGKIQKLVNAELAKFKFLIIEDILLGAMISQVFVYLKKENLIYTSRGRSLY